MKLKCDLTKKGDIDKLISSLEDYRDGIIRKRDMFLRKLVEAGYKTAKENLGQYGQAITIQKDFEDDKAVLVAMDKYKIIKVWYADKKKKVAKSYEISPILMAEFGSGWLAKVLDDVEGVGQGTMPNQKHSFDPHGWWWYDENGKKHHSIGEAPTFPMHAASMAMLFQIDEIAKKVFK